MPDNVDAIIDALPEANREAIRTLVGSINETNQADIDTLKGQHGEAIETLKESGRQMEIRIASLGAGGGGGKPGDGAGDTLAQVTARHAQEKADTAQKIKDDAAAAEIKGYRDREFARDIADAKAEGVPQNLLDTVEGNPKTLQIVRAIHQNNGGGKGAGAAGKGAGGSGGSGIGAGGGGGSGDKPTGTVPTKVEGGLAVLAAHGDPFGATE